MKKEFEDIIAEAAAYHISELIREYDLLIGLNQVALIHRPSGDFVQIYNAVLGDTTIDHESGAPSPKVSLPKILIDLTRHSVKINP